MLTRRELLKRSALLGGYLAVSGLLGACAGREQATPVGTPGTVVPGGVPTPTLPTGVTPTETVAKTPAVITRRGGTFVAAISLDPTSLDPAATGEPQARTIRGLISEPLFDLDPEGKLIPRLVESWEQRDERTYILHLRRGVKFHDGTPFDAEVVKFNIERMRNPETKNVWINEIAQLDTVEVVDTYTVKLTSKGPFAPFLIPFYDVNGMQLSPAAVERWGSEIGLHPVGTGPFKLVEYVKDQHVVLERNPDYWKEGKPYLDQLIFRPIPNDATRLTELRSGTVHLVEYLPFQDIERLRASGEVIVSEKPGFRVDWIGFNMEKEPSSIKEFRQAWSWLIDRDAIQQVVYYGTGAPAWDLFLPGTRFYDPNYRPTERNVEKAKELLAASGVKLPLDITMYITQDPVRQREAQMLQAFASEVGINITVQVEDTAAWRARHQAGDFIMNLSWWGFRPDPDQYIGVNLECGGGWNWSRYCNPEFDELLRAERTELDDAKRIRIFRQIAEIITEDAPFVPYHYGSNIKGLSPKVQGFVHRVDGLVRYEDIWLEQ